MKLLNYATLLLALIIFGSCSLIFMPAKQKINFTTTDDNSVVFADNVEIGRGKTFTTKIKKSGAKQVVMQTPGYHDENIVLLPTRRAPLS
jgi:hypothetical protein